MNWDTLEFEANECKTAAILVLSNLAKVDFWCAMIYGRNLFFEQNA